MIVLYVVSFIFLVSIIYAALKKSEFGMIIFFAEFSFCIGLCLYPILFEANLLTPGSVEQSYISTNGIPGLMTAINIFLYSTTSVLAYFFSSKLPFVKPNTVVHKIAKIAKPTTIWHFLILFGVASYVVYFILVGVNIALINAIYARSGYFDGFGEGKNFLFIKTAANFSLFASLFVPYMLLRRKYDHYMIIYILVVAIAYLTSISRSLILNYMIVPLSVAIFSLKQVKLKLFLFGGVVSFSLLILFFGKSFGSFLSYSLSNYGDLRISVYQGEDGIINAVFRNYSFIWLSVDAGWLSFVKNGSILPKDSLLAAFFGFIPSQWLEKFGLEWLYYGNIEDRVACINTYQFGIDGCTIPPLFTGISVYIFPVAGPIVFGFIKYFIYAKLEKIWIYYKYNDYSKTWVPYFLFSISSNFMSFIPSAIPLASLSIILVTIIIFFLQPKKHSFA